MEGLEIFSTVLWHLKQDVQMCALAHEIADKEILSCEVWCAIGNCFSRQKEHETALKFFKRVRGFLTLEYQRFHIYRLYKLTSRSRMPTHCVVMNT